MPGENSHLSYTYRYGVTSHLLTLALLIKNTGWKASTATATRENEAIARKEMDLHATPSLSDGSYSLASTQLERKEKVLPMTRWQNHDNDRRCDDRSEKGS